MTELLTAAQMKAIEAAAIASGEVTGLELMERAGRGVVEAIFEEWPELKATSHRGIVLCGPGNNGGDGFVVARLLREWGWEVEVFLYGDPERLPPDARVNHERWLGVGRVRPLEKLDWHDLKGADLALDALFGIGLSRPVPPGVWGALVMAQESRIRLVAVDILSGICADSGRVISDSGYSDWPADLTVTFERAKRGHVLDAGARLSGRLRVIPIGLDAAMDGLLRSDGADEVADSAGVAGGLLGKESGDHKYSHGHALILSGSSGRGGAARLAARGALRIGAGLVTVGCPLDAIPENAARLDAVMLRGVADGGALAGALEDQRINALCLGPGMGTGQREARLVRVALETRGKARPMQDVVGRGLPRLVLDADALTILAQHPDLFAALDDGCVLTPHAGEFARLFPDIAEKLAAPATTGPAYSKVDATREAAARAGCVVLYKGPDTVIAAPSGRAAINSAHYGRAAPWLATAGSGDVLAGFITGLLARGFSPFDAACTGAWLHVECARSFGPGLIAEDLTEELPKVFRALGL
jgi:hydroxyethylthiazole kinase-like uncharacterized protein yjeF